MVDSNVKVAIRVRPMNQREIDLKAECVVYMEGKQTVLKSTSPTYDGTSTAQKEFFFDHCFWSVHNEGPAKYTSQEDIFETLGKNLLDSIFAGFNSCIFAYGQTGSGKTFSMMGTDDQPGLVPRISSALFSRDISHLKSFHVEASYLELYNEKVRDLLYPTSNFKALKVREHKSFGPYVEGLSHHVVNNTEDIKSLINEGNKCRKTASTKMNEHSSRSHAIFTLTVTQTLQNEHGAMKELLSKVSLVDLSGSERTSLSGATGDRMKESNNINKSLTALGLVINSLAELSEGRRKSTYVNYRDSMLTWLLKNNLGGNSKTVMLATISPASVHYQETLSTLKYADSAKRIVNKVTVNEDIKSKAIAELKDEVRSLREQLQQTEEKYKKELEAKLKESEKLLQELKVSWEEKLKKTETSALERQKHLQRLGITVENIGIRVDEEKCYLINLSSGISNQKELLLYHLGEKTKIGAGDSQDIQVTGPRIALEHCVIDIRQDGEAFLTPNKNAETFVNGSQVQTDVMLSHKDKIKIGDKASFMIHKSNTKPNITHECVNAVHYAPLNQHEEGNGQGNKSMDEECDTSISSDNIQWSYLENTDRSLSECPYSKVSLSMDSSGHGFLDISQSIVSPEISDTKQLEDQDSSDRNITPIKTIISPKNHIEEERNYELKLFHKDQKTDNTINIQHQVSEDDKMCFPINPTSQTVQEQNITDLFMNPTPPSDDLSIEDNHISRSENNPENYDTSEGHSRVSTGAASSEEAASYIRRSRKEIMAVLQKNFNDWMDELDSQDIITQEEYFTVEKMSDAIDKVRALVNVILQKDESVCRAFLQLLKLNQDPGDPSASENEEIHEPDENIKNEFKIQDKRTSFQDLLEKIEFLRCQMSKLTLREVLDIGAECLTPGSSSMENVAWYFIRKLMSLHVEARNISTIRNRSEMSKEDGFMLNEDRDLSGDIHPLDLQCAIFHCSDHFLQQEMISKMSMCQFSVPLLLPASDGPDCTLMLWAMRGIVKKWRPQSLAESKGFLQEHLVKIPMPTFSFVRLGNCRLSKSKILNQILSSTQHCQDVFIHRDMEGGNMERTISSGLVEISWYFPAGKGIFAEPVAFTNLRGELENNTKPFRFLTAISSVVVVFAETLRKTECDLLLKYKNSKTKYLFIIAPEKQKSKKELEEMRESVMSMMEIKKDNILVITKTTNEATTVKMIRSALMNLGNENAYCVSVEDMSQIATQQEISVDEHVAECQAAERKARAITEEIQDVVVYKGKTMKLQAQLLKDLSRLEKELCQMKKQENKNGEKYKSELRKQCDEIRRKQGECEMPAGVFHFIKAIETENRSEKFYFLSWLKYYLDLAARKNLIYLQEKYKEKYSQANDSQELTEIDQKISDSSLGIEHFLREVSQFYEVWHIMEKKKNNGMECSHIPEKAADLLLDGYPLELIDGDASRISVQWISDVLNKVNSKTGGSSRIRVITVLGVQSTGKSTLLNTMFGLQFPVASGRCTRGAFMTLIKVKENLHKDLSYEYLLVIDTEGLKAPELDSLEGSYEHDNELATLVVGLSDITIINMSMENTTEMKDILQIVIHAFLRMKEIGKKPNCQFVHQNVSDVSAPVMNMRDRNKLLEQLNEMTKTVAKMEKKPQYKVFSDVMEYDAEQHHWYIPSLWQGVPPMAPVSAGYSEYVAELKQNILTLMEKNQNQAQTIPKFVRWMGDLWNAVKHENFIFSFRNSLVANAYNKLSMKFSELEWKFNKQIHEWFTNTETIIKNQSEDTLIDKGKECCIKLENIISAEQNKILTWVEEYFQQEKDCVHLIRYKADFIISTKRLGENLRSSSYDKYNNAIQIQKQQHKIKRVRMQYIEKIERKVSSLMEECRKKRHQMDTAKMVEEFEIMWKNTVKELEVTPLQTRDVEKDMILELTKTMRDKGSAVNEKLNQIKHLPKPEKKQQGGIIAGIVTFLKIPYKWWNSSHKDEDIFQSVLNKCCKYSAEQARRDVDYNDTYCRHLLNMIDGILTEEENIPAEQELEMKLVILGHTVTDFQKMHNNFIKMNDPHSQLETLKSEYFNTFMTVFQEKNNSQDLAKRICDTCLKPAMIDYVHRNLGIQLVDDIMSSEGSKTYTSRTFFQYTVLLNLLEENDFRKYVEFSRNYEEFVKNWILYYIIMKYKNFYTLQSKILSGITEKIRDLLNNPEMWNHTKNVEDFLNCFRKKLNSDLVFPQEKMKAIIFRNTANTKEFITNLNNFLTDTKEEITSEIKSLSVYATLLKSTVKPQDELFKKVFGCGKQCPFCKVPCEAGGENHKEHFASVHRPQGLGTYRWETSSILCHDICTTSVCGDGRFKNHDTNEEWHPHKRFKEIYPDWRIQPDPSIEASDYWKFVFKTFNTNFAVEYKAKPAEYPKEWNSLSKDVAKHSLKKTFNM
ncbi:LOW QUALITY PROTEIN: interferon-induced very large GTPase 1-like [Hyla sarda]|uniref:LOW QUALITY PROTEIN: interferon-induced very large GTPase 1-like n=1 Tax=Hyla sarda TaxID=327740 RepID=UPI0024C2549C|nr:LOW QUALITY PROTEIN: interferon-induced very large GTPase 1-like [Hyla sarda]